MSKRVMTLVSLLAVLMTVFCACAANEKPEVPSDSPNTTTETPDVLDALPTETITAEESPSSSGAQVSASLNWLMRTEKHPYYSTAYGIVYRDQSLYGILSLDGTKDTGAVYYNAEPLNKYFTVVTRVPSEPSNLEDINATGLIDGEGHVLIPAEYALIKTFGNDRYFQVFKATEVTQDKENYLIYLTSSMFSLSASDEDTLYKGNWYVYDIEAGKTVDGISACNGYSAGVNGDMIFYHNDNGDSVSVNTQGQPFPENASRMEDGSYYIQEERTVYDAFGKKLFSYADEQYEYIYYYHGFYLCQKYKNGERFCRILDKTGTAVSEEFSKSIQICGENMILMDGAACDFQGNKHVDAVVDTIYQYGDIWYLSNYETKDYYLLDSDFQLLYTGNSASGPKFQSYTMCVVKEDGSNQLFYSFKQKDFIYRGSGAGCGLVVIESADGLKDLVDTRTDEVLASGYSAYTAVETDDGSVYIYANIEGGGRDVFVMD